MKNFSTKDALEKLEPILKTLPYGESTQLRSLVGDFGYLGAIAYLDPSIKRSSISNRDTNVVNRHYLILTQL